jgi:5'-nucleotidase
LRDTPAIVTPAGTAGLEFRDEAETVNALIPELRARGIEAIVVLIHEGGIPTGGYNDCPAISGDIVDIVKKFDKRSTWWCPAIPIAPTIARSTVGSSPAPTCTA